MSGSGSFASDFVLNMLIGWDSGDEFHFWPQNKNRRLCLNQLQTTEGLFVWWGKTITVEEINCLLQPKIARLRHRAVTRIVVEVVFGAAGAIFLHFYATKPVISDISVLIKIDL